MSAEWPPELSERTPGLSLGSLLILLFFVLFAGADRRRASGGIRLATPVFVPLAPDAATQVASELGAAYGELLDAERRRNEG